jgi:hypothetical protein
MGFVSKTEQVRAAIRAGDRRVALKLASDFRVGITTEQRKALKKGYECLHYADTYKQMGVDTDEAIKYAWWLLTTMPVITGAKNV